MDNIELGMPPGRDLTGLKMIHLWEEVMNQGRTGRSFPLSFESLELDDLIGLRYSKQTVLEALRDPKWYFLFDPGFSLIEMSQICGCDPNMRPCRDDKSSAWLAEGSSSWTREAQNPGYYLISMPLLCGLGGDDQDVSIRDLLGSKFERASSRLVLVFGISYFLNFNNYGGFEKCHHLGPERNDLVGVGANCVVAFDPKKGFALYNFSRGGSPKGIGVCLVRKFDF